MKVTYRIPTKEQYAYVEVEEEVSTDFEASAIRKQYEELKAEFSETPGVDRMTFNKFLDNQLSEGDNDVEVYVAMNERQKLVIQEVKKSIKRIAAKE